MSLVSDLSLVAMPDRIYSALLQNQGTYCDALRVWSLSGLQITRSPVQIVYDNDVVTRRHMPTQLFNPPTPVQLDDEVCIVEVVRERHWQMGAGVCPGLVRVCKTFRIHDENTLIFETHVVHTDEALDALSELLTDTQRTGETFTWSDLVSIAVGAVPTEE